jgi:hypothetical protein
VSSPGQLRELGTLVTSTSGGIGWVNGLAVWLLPQQLGIAWKRGRFGGWRTGLGLLLLGLAWLTAAAVGYPVAMVGGDLAGQQQRPAADARARRGDVGPGRRGAAVRGPARRALRHRQVEKVVGVLGALGMGLYLWHKLAELPAAWLGERLGAPIDAGIPASRGSGSDGCGGSRSAS